MRLYFELFLVSVAGVRHVDAAVWASFTSSEQDRLRRAADANGCNLQVSFW